VSGASALWSIGGRGLFRRLGVSGPVGVARQRAFRRLGVSRYVWVVLCAAIVWLGAPAVASAATGWGPPTDINSNNGINSVSCPTSSFCVALGGQPVTDALIFQNGSWGSPSTIDSNGGLTSVSCSSDSYCVAVDNGGNELTYDNGTWSAPAPIDSGGMGISSVSCPASTTVPAPFCMAVDASGNAVTDQGGKWGAPTPVASPVLWFSVSCASASFCMAVGLGEAGTTLTGAAASYNGTSWSAPTTVATGGTFLDSVSCPSSSFCAVVGSGFGGASGLEGLGFTWSGSWSSGQPLAASVQPGGFEGSISCSSASFCQAVYSTPDVATWDGTTWTVGSGIDINASDTKANFASVSCPTQVFCEAVDFDANALTYTGTENTTPPSIEGSPIVGTTLTEVNGLWTNGPTSFTYQWEDCDSAGNGCAPISGATSQTYEVQKSDVGQTIRVQEQPVIPGGGSAPAVSAPTTIAVSPAPTNTAVPRISGTPIQGRTLSESHGAWTNSPTGFKLQWEDCDSSGGSCVAIPGATKQSHTLTAADVGHTIRVQETASNAGGDSSPATSAPTAMVIARAANLSRPVISGATVVGQTLSTSTGGWSGTTPITYTYQWQRCNPACSDIAGATGSSYKLTTADEGGLILVTVTAQNAAGSAQAISSLVGPVTVPISTGPTGPTVAQVLAALRAILGAHGKNASIKSLLKHGSYSVSFAAPSAGSLVISWYEVPKGAKLAKSKKPVLVASGHMTFESAGSATVKIKLTGKGRALLKHSKRLKLTAKGSFTPSGAASTSATRSFSIKR
jgi:hypothetical protein